MCFVLCTHKSLAIPRRGDGKARGFIISGTGTPGILGKSCFLYFCFHNLLKLGKHGVCYFSGKNESATIYKTDGTVETYPIADNVNGNLAKQVDFVLIDPPERSCDPDFLAGNALVQKNFILAVSPDHNDCQGIKKGYNIHYLYGDFSPRRGRTDEKSFLSTSVRRDPYLAIYGVWWHRSYPPQRGRYYSGG